MKFLFMSLIALCCSMSCINHAVAQDFEIGGTDTTVVPLEYRPSLGFFVRAYINGQGPYRFNLMLTDRTTLTRAAAEKSGLKIETKGLRVDYDNQASSDESIVDGTLTLGTTQISLKRARVLPDINLDSYFPVSNYAGILGIDFFRNRIVRFDLRHSQLVLSDRSAPESGDAIDLEQAGTTLDRQPAIQVSFGDRRGKLGLAFGGAAAWFPENSALGRELAEQGTHPFDGVEWTPSGLVHYRSAEADHISIGGHALGRARILRQTDPLPSFPHASGARRIILHIPAFDGVVQTYLLGRFDLTIDNDAGKAWLIALDPKSLPCRHTGIAGFSPWLYRDQAIVRTVDLNTPAAAAGLQPGDPIVSINGGTVQAYYEHLDATCGPLKPVTLVLRNESGDRTVIIAPVLQ